MMASPICDNGFEAMQQIVEKIINQIETQHSFKEI